MIMEWIKVTDRLPTKDDGNLFGEVVVWADNGEEEDYLLCKYDKIADYFDITHWAKIEPPKE